MRDNVSPVLTHTILSTYTCYTKSHRRGFFLYKILLLVCFRYFVLVTLLAVTKMCMFKWSGQHHVPAACRDKGNWLSSLHCVLWVPLNQQWQALLAMWILHSAQAQLGKCLSGSLCCCYSFSPCQRRTTADLLHKGRGAWWPPQQGAGRHCLSKGTGEGCWQQWPSSAFQWPPDVKWGVVSETHLGDQTIKLGQDWAQDCQCHSSREEPRPRPEIKWSSWIHVQCA